MKNVIIYLSTCNKTSYILSTTIYLYKKFINTMNVYFKILGFKKPELTDWQNVEFISLSDEEQNVNEWSIYLYNYFKTINDEFVFFALDDFFPINYINQNAYDYVLQFMSSNDNIGCCAVGSTPDGGKERNEMDTIIVETDEMFLYKRKNHVNYQLVLQPSIWNRKYLCKMLSFPASPWTFELLTTNVANNDPNYNISTSKNLEYKKCILQFCENSALSGKWNGVCVLGLKHEHIVELIEHNLLDLTVHKLIIGAWNMYVDFNLKIELKKQQFIDMCLKYNIKQWIQLYSEYYN